MKTNRTRKKIILSVAVIFLALSDPVFSEVPILEQAVDYQAKIPAGVVREFPLPEGYHEGLYYENNQVWVTNGKGGRTWIVDMESGGVVSEIDPFGSFTEGITANGDGTFWLTDWIEKKLYRVRIEKGVMVAEHEVSVAPAHPTGVVRAGEKLFMLAWTRGMGTKYHLVEFDETGRVLNKIQIKRIHEPAHLAWDGRYLWITSWFSQLVYKVDIDTFKILGSFKSPAPKTTGIAWDGEYFWITGSYAGLYCVEVSGTE